MTTIAPSAPTAAEPTLSEELAVLAADFPQWHLWDSDGRRHYAVHQTRNSGYTVFALDPPSLRQELGEATHALEGRTERAA